MQAEARVTRDSQAGQFSGPRSGSRICGASVPSGTAVAKCKVRPPRSGALAGDSRAPADFPCGSQPCVAASVWSGTCPHTGEFRPQRGAPVASGTPRLAVRGLFGTADDRPRAGTSSQEIIPWSRKSLIRMIVCSSVYRQVSHRPESPPPEDPDNRLLWRQNRFRHEAETVRDTALAVSGLLDATIGGPSTQPPLPRGLSQLSELKNERFREADGSPYRRGLYVFMQRTFPYPMFATFDGPDGNLCAMQRDRSTTPLQALTLLNDPAMDECADSGTPPDGIYFR